MEPVIRGEGLREDCPLALHASLGLPLVVALPDAELQIEGLPPVEGEGLLVDALLALVLGEEDSRKTLALAHCENSALTVLERLAMGEAQGVAVEEEHAEMLVLDEEPADKDAIMLALEEKQDVAEEEAHTEEMLLED